MEKTSGVDSVGTNLSLEISTAGYLQMICQGMAEIPSCVKDVMTQPLCFDRGGGRNVTSINHQSGGGLEGEKR